MAISVLKTVRTMKDGKFWKNNEKNLKMCWQIKRTCYNKIIQKKNSYRSSNTRKSDERKVRTTGKVRWSAWVGAQREHKNRNSVEYRGWRVTQIHRNSLQYRSIKDKTWKDADRIGGKVHWIACFRRKYVSDMNILPSVFALFCRNDEKNKVYLE